MFKREVDVIVKQFSSTKAGQVILERYKFLGITIYKRETALIKN